MTRPLYAVLEEWHDRTGERRLIGHMVYVSPEAARDEARLLHRHTHTRTHTVVELTEVDQVTARWTDTTDDHGRPTEYHGDEPLPDRLVVAEHEAEAELRQAGDALAAETERINAKWGKP